MTPTNRTTLLFAIFAATASLIPGSRGAVINFEFETVGDTEGWTASSEPANALVTGFTATTDIDGNVGVLTSSDIDIDPQILHGSAIPLAAGETWSTLDIRFRHLSGNPQDGGTTSATYASSGTILFFNNSTENLGVGPLETRVTAGTGPFAGDTYALTLTPEATGNWQNLTVDFTAAPTFNSGDITAVRFDPIGNNAAGNFEIDYLRFTSIPEPTLPGLIFFGAAGLAIRRRR